MAYNASMDSKNAYEEVLRLLPEQTVKNLCDDVSNAIFNDAEYYKLHDFLVHTDGSSLGFEIEKVEQTFRVLVAAAQELYDYLPTHSSLIKGTSTLGLYPDREYEDLVFFPEQGKAKTKRDITDEALDKARQLRDALSLFISSYKYKDEPDDFSAKEYLIWNDLDFNPDYKGEGLLSFRNKHCFFRKNTASYWLVYLMFEDREVKKVEKEEIFGTARSLSMSDVTSDKVTQFFKNTLTITNNKIKDDLHTETQLFSESGVFVIRTI